MKLRQLLTLGLVFSTCACKPKVEWICFYGKEADVQAFSKVSTIVLASDTQVPLKSLVSDGKTVLGYLSVGEADPHKVDINDLKAKSVLIGENPTWKSYVVDIRSRYWQELLLNKMIPDLVKKGFNGIFIDTADSVIEVEQKNPTLYKGMQAALVQLLKEIHSQYPSHYIMVNRGIEAASSYAPFVNAILAESLMTDYDQATQKYKLRNPETVQEYLEILKKVNTQHKTPLFSLDYWDPKDSKGIVNIYKEQVKRGFIPYVATIELDKIILP